MFLWLREISDHLYTCTDKKQFYCLLLTQKKNVIQKLGHVISAQPVSACTSSATRNVSGDQEEEEEGGQVLQTQQGSKTPEKTDIHTRAQDMTPETEPPLQKKAKRSLGVEEQEEGEIIDSSDEEEENSREIQCLNKDLPGDGACGESVESHNDQSVLTHHCQLGNESAAASLSCQMEG